MIKTGEHIVSGRLFTELIRKLPAGDVTAEWQDGQVLIRSRLMEFSLHAIEGEEFPEYPVCDQKIMSLTDYELQRLIRNSAFATSNDDHQPIFSGVLMGS